MSGVGALVRERGGVGAEHLEIRSGGKARAAGVGRGGAAEARVRGRRLVESGVRDDAARLARARAGRDVREVAAVGPSLANEHVAAEQQRRDQAAPDHRVRVDLLAHELAEHPRPLRMPDHHHAPPAVVALEVLPPRLAHVAVGELAPRSPLLGAPGVDRGERELAVDRGENATLLREARRLVARYREQLVVLVLVRVRSRLAADGGIDVEAVDRGIGGQGRVLHARAAIGLVDRGLERLAARVGLVTGPAQPDHLRLGDAWHRGEGACDQRCSQDLPPHFRERSGVATSGAPGRAGTASARPRPRSRSACPRRRSRDGREPRSRSDCGRWPCRPRARRSACRSAGQARRS